MKKTLKDKEDSFSMVLKMLDWA